MYSCYTHGWASMHYMCPTCHSGQIQTSSSSDSSGQNIFHKPHVNTCEDCAILIEKLAVAEKIIEERSQAWNFVRQENEVIFEKIKRTTEALHQILEILEK